MSKLISKTLGSLLLAASCSAPLQAENLAEIYQLALTNDAQLRAAHAAYNAGKQAIPRARARILPTLTGSIELTDGDGDTSSARTLNFPGQTFEAGASGSNDDETEFYSLSLSQPLFDLPAWFIFKQGFDLDKQATANLAAEQQSLIVRVVGTYTEVLRTSEDLITAKAEQRAIGRQLEQTKERFEVGLLPITDVHEAQAAFDAARVNTLEAEGALDIAFEGLEVLTGKPYSELAGLAAEFPIKPTEPADPAAWVEFAQSNNFNLAAARLNMQAAEKNSRAKRAEHLPKVSAHINYSNYHREGSFDIDSATTNQPFSEDNEPLVFSVRMNAPLYTGGLVSAERKIAQQNFIEAQENLLLAKRQTTQQARSQHLKVSTNSARVSARALGIISAQSALEATQAGYDVGTRNIVDLLISQRVLYRSQRDYANARYDYIISMFNLKEVAGLLSPDDINTLNTWMKPELVVGKSASRVKL
ncbi:MAG: TolC family outer membrane protein [Gammaproteobacteria bacterium]|nr:TolC family outer membrane protein [Gammaproteobacteria bacterium]MBQ0841186.1 TolC family outer membrane protein [Gammaproteobacteria bacterium]